jgi:gliding motility-associated-like protein
MRSVHMLKIIFPLFLVCFILPSISFGTHLRGGEITVVQLNCTTYEITLSLYTDTGSIARAGNGTLSFGDGGTIQTPDLPNEIIDSKLRVGRATFKIIHTFKDGAFLLSYAEPNRNGGTLNIPDAAKVPFYTETLLTVALETKCNNPVTFKVLPIDRACKGVAFFHNPGAIDIDGDSLTYELVTPKRALATVVVGYSIPNKIEFYPNQNYQQSNESQDGAPVFKIDPLNGDLLWDAPGKPGEYVVAIKVNEWKKIEGNWKLYNYVVRDMQIFVEDCENNRPYLQVPEDLCVTAGSIFSETIRGFDKDFDQVKIEVFLTDDFSPVQPIVINQGIPQSTKAPNDTANVKFRWNVTCGHVRDQPYRITFKITDIKEKGIPLASFKTWSISVLGASPIIASEVLDLEAKSLKLEWPAYGCAEAQKMEVWKKVGKDNLLGPCIRGLSRANGYEKVATLVNQNFYVDRDINPGATYCYRLVALFESRGGSKSKASLPFCFGPVKVDAPAMTHVSVLSTDVSAGQILVRWTSPFEINKSQFPPPYEYEIYRSNDGLAFAKANTTRLRDTTFVDRSLNTLDKKYAYRIVVYSPNGLTKENPIDTSALAFYPRLESEHGKNSVLLKWDAIVPWSNLNARFPYHYIYRKSFKNSFYLLIDSLDTRTLSEEVSFEYVDHGQYKQQPLEQNTIYQYKVSTTGTYDNPKIIEPLINFSNEVLGQPIDKTPPCQPVLTVNHISCENFLQSNCRLTEFKNTLEWVTTGDCGNDVMSYKILFSELPSNEPILLSTVSGELFVHTKPNSFAGCYRLVAVDWSGNESEASEIQCVDNCPNIFIPNVFTANDDGYNDSFPGTSVDDPSKCSRFVEELNFKIYNRWGKEVFAFKAITTDGQLDWKGLDKEGKELPAGIYYYIADAKFSMIDPDQQKQLLKGWVNLIR